MRAQRYSTIGVGELEHRDVAFCVDDGEENEVVNVYPAARFQTFEGFGGAITDAAGYVFSLMGPERRREFLKGYFTDDGLGYVRARIHMDSCDFCTHLYEADSDPDDELLERFSFADTERYILPLLDAAERVAGRRLKLMLTPWSPPAYMKTNGSRVAGGSLKPEYRQRWADYICRYIHEFTDRGYEVERISVQNEPKAVQTWDSCIFSVQEEKEFLRDNLVPTMREQGLGNIEVFVWDHNKERVYERACGIIDKTTDSMVAGVAFHWYSGDHFEALDLVARQFPHKKMILSESCVEFGKYDRDDTSTNARRLAHDMIGNLNAGMCAFYDWNILLDHDGGPNHKGNFCDAPYLYDVATGALEERLCYRYSWHFAHFIRPGAVRLGCTRYTDRLDATAWENVDGSVVLVLLNKSDEKLPVNLRTSGQIARLSLAAGEITTLLMEPV